MKKRYDVYKDYTKKFVLEMMNEESSDKQVVKEIMNRVANISFCKKVINKKAMVYKDGVKREVFNADTKTQEQIDTQVDNVNLNSIMKKVNKYAELFKNGMVSVLPYPCPKTNKYYYMPKVLQPYLYDVIEDQHNPELARVVITSYYNRAVGQSNYAPEHQSGQRDMDISRTKSFRDGDGSDQKIADAPNDQGIKDKEYIWWSNVYHFTTDYKGTIISGKQEKDLLNPIGELPFYNFSKDQDGAFWALGGDDLIDGSILLNMLMSDLFYIAKYQGMGIGFMFGKGVPKNAKVGASSFITMEVEEGDPTPQLGFASSNPPIGAHLDMIESYVAYLLSTNNLDAGAVQSKLTGVGSAASGIHEIVKRSENIDDIQDQREMYRDGEPVIFSLMAKWHNLYLERKQLKTELASMGTIDPKAEVGIKFPDAQAYVSEKEKLEIIDLRMNKLGLDTLLESIMRDNSDLTQDQAKEKLRLRIEQKLKESSAKLKLFNKNPEEPKEELEEIGGATED